MFSEAQVKIQKALSELIQQPCVASVRVARQELSSQELHKLSGELQAKWKKLSAESRRLEWSEARRCEEQIRSELGQDAAISISHTRQDDLPIVFAVGAPARFQIGIDAELKTRIVSELLARRIESEAERALPLTPLQVWVIKEAVFKSNRPDNDGSAPTQYRIVSYDSETRSGTAEFEHWKMRFTLIDLPQWVVAVATRSS